MTQADEAAVRREREGWKAAFESGDVDRIMAFYAPGAETVAFDVLPPLRFDGERAYREEWTKFLGMFDGGVSVEVSQVTVTASAEVAFVHGLCHISGVLRSGGTRDLWMRATNGLRKIDGKWLVTHDHVSVPADITTGKASMDLQA